MAGVLRSRSCEDIDSQKKKRQVSMEAEIGVMQLKVRNTKDYWPSPGARREVRDRFLPELLEGAGPC